MENTVPIPLPAPAQNEVEYGDQEGGLIGFSMEAGVTDSALCYQSRSQAQMIINPAICAGQYLRPAEPRQEISHEQ